jgi:hypothetical protein
MQTGAHLKYDELVGGDALQLKVTGEVEPGTTRIFLTTTRSITVVRLLAQLPAGLGASIGSLRVGLYEFLDSPAPWDAIRQGRFASEEGVADLARCGIQWMIARPYAPITIDVIVPSKSAVAFVLEGGLIPQAEPSGESPDGLRRQKTGPKLPPQVGSAKGGNHGGS